MQLMSKKPGSYGEVLRLAWPLIIGTCSSTLMLFCDRLFLSWHSPVSIQAAVPAGMLSWMMICGFVSLAAYTNTFVAQYYGAGDLKACSRATAQGIFISIMSTIPLLLLIPVGQVILGFFEADPVVLSEEVAYYSITMLASPLVLLNSAIGSFFTGQGRTRTTMVVVIISELGKILLDYAMIFGHWGFPEMGIRGAAWATAIAEVLAPLILFICYFSRKNRQKYHTWQEFRFDATLFRRIIKFGLPAGLHLALDISSYSIFILLLGSFDKFSQTVGNIVLSINLLAFVPIIGLSIAASTLVGQYQGRKEPDLAHRSALTSFKIAVAYAALMGLSFVIFARFYLSLFIGTGEGAISLAELWPTGRILLFLMAIWGMGDAGEIILSASLKGAGDTKFVMAYSLAIGWCYLVLGQLLIIYVFKGGLLVSWAWTCSYLLLLATGYFLRLQSRKWQHIDLLGHQTT